MSIEGTSTTRITTTKDIRVKTIATPNIYSITFPKNKDTIHTIYLNYIQGRPYADQIKGWILIILKSTP